MNWHGLTSWRGWLFRRPTNPPVDRDTARIEDTGVSVFSQPDPARIFDTIIPSETRTTGVKVFTPPHVREVAAYYGIRRVDTGSWRAILQPSGEHDIFTTESRDKAEEAIRLYNRDVFNWRVDVLLPAELERQRIVLRLLERSGVR